MEKRIDAHCHVFNKDIITYRIILHLFASLWKALSKHNNNETKTSRDYLQLLQQLRNIIDFIEAGWEENSTVVFENMEKSYVAIFGQDFIATPLMFDLLYCFRGSAKTEDANEVSKETISADVVVKNSDQVHTGLKGLISKLLTVQKEIEQTISSLEGNDAESAVWKGILHDLKELITSFKKLADKLLSELKKIKWIGGFNTQKKQMQDLRGKYPDKVFPFYAADPRRPGIAWQIKHNVDGEHYYGVKIYAPNGYSPTDPDMLKIYDHCIEKNLPVTSHCSYMGFATFENTVRINGLINDPKLGLIKLKRDKYTFEIPFLKEGWVQNRASVLNHPKIWERVLMDYPGLKLNLAHFGNSNDGYEWTNIIFEMMHKYPTLYTDLSSVTDRTKLISFKELFWDKATDDVKSRFMYGSDFYLCLMYTDNFNTYLQNFKDIFSESEFRQIAWENPVKFLGIPGI